MVVALIQKAPYSALEPAEGLRHLGGLEVLGFDQGAGVFVDEGVYTLRKGQSVPDGLTSLEDAAVKLLASGVKLYAERSSLSERHLEQENLIEGVQIVDDISELVNSAGLFLIF